MATVDQQIPFPDTIEQMGKQYVLFDGFALAPSPYTIKAQETIFFTASHEVLSHSRPQGVKTEAKGIRVVYTAQDEAKPWTVEEATVHFKNHRPFLHLLSVDRAITVSHWGRIYVTEDYHVLHDGAKSVGRFSRWNATTPDRGNRLYVQDNPHITHLQANLPSGAQYVIFKDGIGQILSMSAHESRTRTNVNMEPRYPLFGGWQTQFTLEYSMPLASAMRGSGDRRELSFVQAPLLQEDFQADVVTTRVALPEGSSNLHVDTGRLSASISDDRTFSYLDTNIGRPTKVITTRRMTGDDTSARVYVTYKFSPVFALLEPALLCAVFAVLFAVILGVFKLDLTIVRGAEWRAQQSAAKAHEVLLKVEGASSAALRVAEEAAAAPSKEAAADLEGHLPALLEVAKELEGMGAPQGGAVTALAGAYARLIAECKKPSKGKAGADLPALLSQAQAAHSEAFKEL